MFLRSLALAAVLSAAMFAQTASVTGRVTDPGGAVVPDATVTVQSTTSGVSTTAKSNDEGYYSVPALNPGAYDVTVSPVSGVNSLGFAQKCLKNEDSVQSCVKQS